MRDEQQEPALALSDADSGRLLHELSMQGPTAPRELAILLGLPRERVDAVVEHAVALGVVTTDAYGRHRIEAAAVEAAVKHNRERLFGHAA